MKAPLLVSILGLCGVVAAAGRADAQVLQVRVSVKIELDIFGFLFLGAAPPVCRESADAQNDGRIDVSDGIAILNFRFTGGAAACTAKNGGVNADGKLDLSDAVTILGPVFLGSPEALAPLAAMHRASSS